MNPTVLYKYKPQLKKVKLNYHSFSQISGSSVSIPKKEITEGGVVMKKLSRFKNQGPKDERSRNREKYNYSNNTTSNFLKKNKKIYEYDALVISHKDMDKKIRLFIY